MDFAESAKTQREYLLLNATTASVVTRARKDDRKNGTARKPNITNGCTECSLRSSE